MRIELRLFTRGTGAVAMAVFVVAFFSALLTGCSTMPLPSSPRESLVVFPYNIEDDWRQGNIKVKSVDLKILNEQTREVKTVSLIPGDHYRMVAFEPGRYFLTQLIVMNQWHSDRNNVWYDDHNRYVSFFINERTVKLFPQQVYFSGFAERDGYQIGMRFVGDEKEKKILSALEKDRRWLAWEDYQLIGF